MRAQIITFIIFWLGQVAFFAFNFISSKQLSPTDYGVFNIILAFIMFGMRFIEVGIGDFYVVKGVEKNLKTVFTINFAKGVIIFLIFIGLSFMVNNFYGSSEMRVLLMATSLIFMVEPLKNPMIYSYYKERNLVPVVITEKGTYIFSLVIGILLMLYYKSIWVLIGVYLFYFLLQTIISFLIMPRPQASTFDRVYAREIIQFSKHILGFILLGYLVRQGLDLLIPKLIGISEFAIYSFTFLIGVAPVNFLIYPLNKLIYPIYAIEIRKNAVEEIVNRVFIKTYFLIIFLSLTIYFFSPLVLNYINHTSLFDYQLLSYILVYSLFRGVAANLGVVFKAINKQKSYNKVLIMEALIIVLGLTFFNQTVYQIALVLTSAIFIHLLLGLIALNKSIKLMQAKFILNILGSIAFVIIEVYLSNHFNVGLFLTMFNALIFIYLLFNFITSLNKYFVRT